MKSHGPNKNEIFPKFSYIFIIFASVDVILISSLSQMHGLNMEFITIWPGAQ